jgi:hypothetical protein
LIVDETCYFLFRRYATKPNAPIPVQRRSREVGSGTGLPVTEMSSNAKTPGGL